MAIEEPKLLVKSLSTHLGLETEDETKNPHSILEPEKTKVVKSTDLDQLEKRYRAKSNISFVENVFQMCLIMIESFLIDDTIGFMAMFNFMFGLLMCTLTFGEHIGHKFAAK